MSIFAERVPSFETLPFSTFLREKLMEFDSARLGPPDADRFCYWAKDEDGISGGMEIHRAWGNYAILTLRADPPGNGIGSLLMERFFKDAKAAIPEDEISCIVTVTALGDRAAPFYRKHGFCETGRVPQYIGTEDFIHLDRMLFKPYPQNHDADR